MCYINIFGCFLKSQLVIFKWRFFTLQNKVLEKIKNTNEKENENFIIYNTKTNFIESRTNKSLSDMQNHLINSK